MHYVGYITHSVAGTCIPDYTVSHLRRLLFTYLSPPEAQISLMVLSLILPHIHQHQTVINIYSHTCHINCKLQLLPVSTNALKLSAAVRVLNWCLCIFLKNHSVILLKSGAGNRECSPIRWLRRYIRNMF